MVKCAKCKCSVTNCTWNARNNSSNITAILQPENYKRYDSGEETISKDFPSKNLCYCTDRPIKPRLLSRPKTCPNYEENERIPPAIRLATCRCKFYQVCKCQTPGQGIHQTHPSQQKQTEASFQSDDNLNVDGIRRGMTTAKTYPGQQKQSETSLQSDYDLNADRVRKGIITAKDQESSKNGIRSSTQDLLQGDAQDGGEYFGESSRASSPRKNTTELSQIGSSTQDDLKRLNDFRNDHFFETHSVQDLTKPVPDHTCVHRFELDSRFLPRPLNGDSYGLSRCVICGKPMENYKSSGAKDERLGRNRGVFPKFYKYGLAPRQVYVGNGDVKIEMTVGDDRRSRHVHYHKSDECKWDRPSYFNTYALRYQKGVKGSIL